MAQRNKEMQSRIIFPIEHRGFSALWISKGNLALTTAENEILQYQKAIELRDKEIIEMKKRIVLLEKEKSALLDDIDKSN